MRVIETRIMPPGAKAVTIFPFGCFAHPDYVLNRPHEEIHWKQQRRWAIRGLGVGLLLWFVLYLLVLPAGWNPLRWSAESEAMSKADHLSDDEIAWKLRQPPYYLWWHS